MTFLKLHNKGREVLVNMINVTDIHKVNGDSNSVVYLNCEVGGVQAHFNVDESLDEILELFNRASKGGSEVDYTMPAPELV